MNWKKNKNPTENMCGWVWKLKNRAGLSWQELIILASQTGQKQMELFDFDGSKFGCLGVVETVVIQ